MGRSGTETTTPGDADFFADLKINLIYPCTETHVKKYSKQGVRFVTETPSASAQSSISGTSAAGWNSSSAMSYDPGVAAATTIDTRVANW